MNIYEAFPSSYIKAADLKGRRVALTMKDVSIESMGDERKPVLHFQGTDKGLVLNKTNASVIAEMYGPETESWIGKKITVYASRVEFQGRIVDGIRVHLETPAEVDTQAPLAQAAPPEPPAHPGTYANAKNGNGVHRGIDDEIPF